MAAPAIEEQLHHRRRARQSRGNQQRRTAVVRPRVDVGAVLEQDARLLRSVTARISGVAPASLRMLGSAPSSRSRLTALAVPQSAASISRAARGVERHRRRFVRELRRAIPRPDRSTP